MDGMVGRKKHLFSQDFGYGWHGGKRKASVCPRLWLWMVWWEVKNICVPQALAMDGMVGRTKTYVFLVFGYGWYGGK